MYSDKSPLDGSDATHLGVWLGEKRPQKQSSEKQRANQRSVNAVARFLCVSMNASGCLGCQAGFGFIEKAVK